MKDDKHNSLYFARKYARIFVLGHNLVLEAHSFASWNRLCPQTNILLCFRAIRGYCESIKALRQQLLNLWSNSLNFWYFLCYPLAFQWTTFQHFTGTIRKGVVVTCWIDQNARGRVEWGARSKRDEGEGRKGADTSESFTAQRLR